MKKAAGVERDDVEAIPQSVLRSRVLVSSKSSQYSALRLNASEMKGCHEYVTSRGGSDWLKAIFIIRQIEHVGNSNVLADIARMRRP